jgi:hypothetical protein
MFIQNTEKLNVKYYDQKNEYMVHMEENIHFYRYIALITNKYNKES